MHNQLKNSLKNGGFKMSILNKVGEALTEVRNKTPLVHHITNYVTVNDCANIVLALGGSPVMADDEKEVEDMVAIASALVINIGTLNSRTVNSMILAGKKANKLKIPVILDPVGVGATAYRTEIAKKLIEEIKFSVIRGNISEIKNIAGIKSNTKGVDAEEVTEEKNLVIKEKKILGETLSEELGAVIAITGEVDSISFENQTYFVANGHKTLSKVTGTGCMCTSLIGCFCGANDDYFLGTLAGILSMGIAGEIAHEKTKDLGTSSFRVALIDSISKLDAKIIMERSKINCEI